MVAGGQQRAARLADVARAAGVSQGTVSNVFNRPNLVREEVRDHVHEVALNLGYRGPDPKGRLLRAGKFNAIGVATSDPLAYFFDDPFARELMQGMAEACDANGAGLSLVSARNSERLAWNIESALVDGLVLLCIDDGERLVELTRERQLPFIALALGRSDESISTIGIDDYAGAKLAATHLAELGHRRFAVLAIEFVDGRFGPVTMAEIEAAVFATPRHRAQGYFAALQSFGIDTTRIPVFATLGDPKTIALGLDHIFAQATRPTALLCMSDRVALLTLDWLKARGLRVPQDISVVGFDGVPEATRSSPPLTTIAQPIAEIGRRAVQAIIDHDGAVHREVLPVELIIGGSTAAAKLG